MKDTSVQIKKTLASVLEEMQINNPNVELSFSKYGTFATNVAMKTAKVLNQNPLEVAHKIREKMETIPNPWIEKTEVAKPGFINFYLSDAWYQKQVEEIVSRGKNYGKGKQGKFINIEYVSVNPTGFLHAGHARGAVIGSTLSNILKFAGNKVDQEYYINDMGNQIKLLGRSVWTRYLQELGSKQELPEDAYRGEDIKIAAKAMVEKFQNKYKDSSYNEAVAGVFEEEAKTFFMQKIKAHLKQIDVELDIYSSEKAIASSKNIDKTFKKLEGSVYEKENAVWLETTKKGDDKDRVLRKSNGLFTYFATDIAYHNEKISRKYDELINIWGTDHIGYVPRMTAALELLGLPKNKMDFLMVNMVKIIRDGKEVKMSKRSGNSLPLFELNNWIGKDALRFYMLHKSSTSNFNLDINLAKKQSNENPVFTVQYTNARCHQLLCKAQNHPSNEGSAEKLQRGEKPLINMLLMFPSLIIKTAKNHQVNNLTQYVMDLCKVFNSFYSNTKIIGSGREKQLLNLTKAVQTTIKNTLHLLGISAPDKM